MRAPQNWLCSTLMQSEHGVKMPVRRMAEQGVNGDGGRIIGWADGSEDNRRTIGIFRVQDFRFWV